MGLPVGGPPASPGGPGHLPVPPSRWPSDPVPARGVATAEDKAHSREILHLPGWTDVAIVDSDLNHPASAHRL
jgi:hypothetical protein